MIPKFHSTAVRTALSCLLKIVACVDSTTSLNRVTTKSLTEYAGSPKIALPSKTSAFSRKNVGGG
ncbi:hypothetical protein PF005_g28218 [Phytophthora fragariae]|uniref:Kinesin motor domain-containing protein n=1 Tax=Phytophthora fragariae TaxID=53985 RepID=A0A6A3DL66_9STRA|nr:hypothetical protein PF003_g13334 [Phytophthora fragariae]KAE8902716.1 hypothetical protein PF003_g13341 [Phytophthora fragariae]KAE8920956.1 hypothetical protein PF009_g28757 [Phytophthora fragariae]KAE8968028.1 hypothetical protein PF011_g27337 [Phytophthora fragariae]KAE9066612.1 hypothetical protein PF010_g27789 [Phytophthora fragariae]